MEIFNSNCIITKRSVCIDIIRGLAIFLVVCGHAIQYSTTQGDFFENKLFQLIYSFHMPLFMIISGYLAYGSIGKKSFCENVRGKLKTLAWPMLVWGLFDLLIQFRSFSIVNLMRESIGIWFLYSLLINYFVFILIKLVNNSCLKRVIIILAGGNVYFAQ